MTELRHKLLAIGLASTIFAAGGVVGAVIDRHWVSMSPPGSAHTRHHDHLLEMFRKHLDLSDDQAEQISAIMERTQADAEAILGEMNELHERAQREILDVLTEEQAAKYRKMIEHRKWVHGEHGSH